MTSPTTRPLRSGSYAIATFAFLAILTLGILWFRSPEAEESRAEAPTGGARVGARVQAPPGLDETLAARDAIAESEPEGRLVAAARAGRVDEVRQILREGVSPDARESKNGHGALHQGARSGSLVAVDLLLEAGADPDAPDGHGMSPLMWAAASTSVPVGRRLLEAGSDPNAQPEPKRQTALSQLVGGEMRRHVQGRGSAPERLEFARLLFEHGADPNAASEGGLPVRTVIAVQDAEMLALFLDYGAQLADVADIHVLRRMPGPIGEMLHKAISREP